MAINQIIENIKNIAKEYGMRLEDNSTGRLKQNAVWRNNTKEISSSSNAYFGIIREGEATSQSYSDLSLVFFPKVADPSILLMCLGVGSEGFRNDYEIASQPGLRRSFLKLLPPENHITFCKKLFTDTTTRVDFDKEGYSIDRYLQVLLIGVEVDPSKPSDWNTIKGWIARYAQMRGWDYTKAIKDKVNEAKDQARHNETIDDLSVIKDLLAHRKYIVIEGAPGVGKTYMATLIAKDYKKVFFTQFHAGTTYADFVYGIMPKLGTGKVEYEPHAGELLNAIDYANANLSENCLLIIDEINRANLASVLGEVFYLFEPKRELVPDFEIKIGLKSYKAMPENLHVLATMNTADRSLAVVDYALRRRFAWYKLEPKPFDNLSSDGIKLYDRMAQIFEYYATDMELNLQPGASYFMGKDLNEIKDRLRYELMPLIKEYLLNGLMRQAEQALDDYFFENIKYRIFN